MSVRLRDCLLVSASAAILGGLVGALVVSLPRQRASDDASYWFAQHEDLRSESVALARGPDAAETTLAQFRAGGSARYTACNALAKLTPTAAAEVLHAIDASVLTSAQLNQVVDAAIDHDHSRRDEFLLLMLDAGHRAHIVDALDGLGGSLSPDLRDRIVQLASDRRHPRVRDAATGALLRHAGPPHAGARAR